MEIWQRHLLSGDSPAGVWIYPPPENTAAKAPASPAKTRSAGTEPPSAPTRAAAVQPPAAAAPPATERKTPPAGPSTGIRIVLVVDGNIVDLNRIRLPADTPIIDEQFTD